MHMDYYTKGIIVGIGLAMLFFIAAKLFTKKKFSSEKQFDERQKIARGIAFTYAYSTLIIYFAIYGLLDLIGIVFCENFMGIVIGIFLSLGVFACTAIVKDAFIGIGQKKKSIIIIYIACIVANIAGAITNIIEGKVIENGMLSHGATNIIVAVLFTVVLIIFLMHNRKKAEDDE